MNLAEKVLAACSDKKKVEPGVVFRGHSLLDLGLHKFCGSWVWVLGAGQVWWEY